MRGGLREAKAGLKAWGELESSLSAEGSEKNFQKVLDDAAKADQNLASLLLTTKCECSLFWLQSELFEYLENIFRKYLTTTQKAD